MSRRNARQGRWPLHLIRTAAALVLLDTLAQAALAGLFVTGDLDLLTWHSVNADALAALTFVQAASALVVRWRLAGPVWPVGASVLLIVLVGAQQALGEARILAGHLPLAMAIFGLGTALTYWTWTFNPAAADAHEAKAEVIK
ncbi:hypothetical protein ACFYU9_05690 [Streptomyces sp. NPDC004327]|uniref:hypothetical protein n=1 Tax=Streptomyces sp. NPDC004327 TaxID=3364699 RepID=UPI0036A482E2